MFSYNYWVAAVCGAQRPPVRSVAAALAAAMLSESEWRRTWKPRDFKGKWDSVWYGSLQLRQWIPDLLVLSIWYHLLHVNAISIPNESMTKRNRTVATLMNRELPHANQASSNWFPTKKYKKNNGSKGCKAIETACYTNSNSNTSLRLTRYLRALGRCPRSRPQPRFSSTAQRLPQLQGQIDQGPFRVPDPYCMCRCFLFLNGACCRTEDHTDSPQKDLHSLQAQGCRIWCAREANYWRHNNQPPVSWWSENRLTE